MLERTSAQTVPSFFCVSRSRPSPALYRQMAVVSRQSSPSKDDAALIERAREGDEQALGALYRRHAAHIAGVVYRLLGADAELEDIVQETFVDGLQQLHALRAPDKFRSYLVTIAVRRVQARLSLRYRMRGLARNLFGCTPRVGDARAREEIHSLYGVLQRQNARHRVAWVLHRIEGYTLPEVAEQTQSSLATVKRWITEIDSHLEEEHHGPG
jgi:RNA polymerase sigma-70 factor, ECF subfamily